MDLPSPRIVLQDQIKQGYDEIFSIFKLKSKREDILLKGAQEFKFIQSFSIFKIFPRLCLETTFVQKVMIKNPLGIEEKHQRLNRINREDIQSMKGIMCVNYVLYIMLFGLVLQLDMNTANRWKSFEVMSYMKFTWVLISTFYMCLDTVLMFIAMIQTNKLLKYLREMSCTNHKHIDKEEPPIKNTVEDED